MSRGRTVVRSRKLLAVLAVGGIGLLVVWRSVVYRGFVGTVVGDLRHAPWSEVADQYRFLWYYATFYRYLAVNPRTGLVDLQAARRAAWADRGASGRERGTLAFHEGAFATAIRELEADIAARGETETTLFWLAMAHLRQAESENCLDRLTGPGGIRPAHPPERLCALPIRAHHDRPGATFRAAGILQHLLDAYDRDNELYRWLLNFAYMSLGRYPDGVPERYLVVSAFTDAFYGSGAAALRERFPDLSFRERARELGVATLDVGKGVAVEDFDGDGYMDIATGGTFSRLRLYLNDGGRRFVDHTAEAGLDWVSQPYIITAADYDDDGDVDLFVSRPFTHLALLQNRGDATFTDATFSSGLLERPLRDGEAEYGCVSAWGDIDNDGDLDLFVARFGQRLPAAGGLLGREPTPSRLYLNDGGRFRDGTAAMGLTEVVEDRIFLGATFGDFDRDGWPDLFLSSFERRHSVLLRNLRGRRFEPVPLELTPQPGFTAAFLDLDHDGWLDLFQATQSPARTTTRRVVFGRNQAGNAHRILFNDRGRLREDREVFGAHGAAGSMGASFGDLDNDGCHDFYLGTGNPESWLVLPNLMYLGEQRDLACTGRLTDISALAGFGSVQKGHGIVFFDFDNDGDQDVYSSLGGMWPGDAWPNQLFVNESILDASWVKIRLEGETSNRFGVGATIRVVASTLEGEEIVRYYTMDNKTGFGSAPYLAHIGLGRASRIQEVEVWWPTSRSRRIYRADLHRLNVLAESAGRPSGDRGRPAS